LLHQSLTESASEENGWRQSVAVYLSLYTADTLAIISDYAAAREQEIAAMSPREGIALTPRTLACMTLTS
jgi:predicted HTH domain antitoxin